jgi:hypothetical protein
MCNRNNLEVIFFVKVYHGIWKVGQNSPARSRASRGSGFRIRQNVIDQTAELLDELSSNPSTLRLVKPDGFRGIQAGQPDES